MVAALSPSVSHQQPRRRKIILWALPGGAEGQPRRPRQANQRQPRASAWTWTTSSKSGCPLGLAVNPKQLRLRLRLRRSRKAQPREKVSRTSSRTRIAVTTLRQPLHPMRQVRHVARPLTLPQTRTTKSRMPPRSRRGLRRRPPLFLTLAKRLNQVAGIARRRARIVHRFSRALHAHLQDRQEREHPRPIQFLDLRQGKTPFPPLLRRVLALVEADLLRQCPAVLAPDLRVRTLAKGPAPVGGAEPLAK